MKEIQRLAIAIYDWANKTFGDRGLGLADSRKLHEETDELMHAIISGDNKHIREELADCFTLILNIATSNDISVRDLVDETKDKLLINSYRKWIYNEQTGAFDHDKEDINELPFN